VGENERKINKTYDFKIKRVHHKIIIKFKKYFKIWRVHDRIIKIFEKIKFKLNLLEEVYHL